jgi:hypothetical protein
MESLWGRYGQLHLPLPGALPRLAPGTPPRACRRRRRRRRPSDADVLECGSPVDSHQPHLRRAATARTILLRPATSPPGAVRSGKSARVRFSIAVTATGCGRDLSLPRTYRRVSRAQSTAATATPTTTSHGACCQPPATAMPSPTNRLRSKSCRRSHARTPCVGGAGT